MGDNCRTSLHENRGTPFLSSLTSWEVTTGSGFGRLVCPTVWVSKRWSTWVPRTMAPLHTPGWLMCGKCCFLLPVFKPLQIPQNSRGLPTPRGMHNLLRSLLVFFYHCYPSEVHCYPTSCFKWLPEGEQGGGVSNSCLRPLEQFYWVGSEVLSTQDTFFAQAPKTNLENHDFIC